QSKPDGYTIGFGPTSPIAGALHLMKNVAYGVDDFIYVCQVFENVFTISVPKASPFTSLPQLLDAARANPGKLNYGHAGIGTVPHLSMAGLVWKANVDITAVPFRGDAPMIPQLAAGQLDMGVPAVS